MTENIHRFYFRNYKQLLSWITIIIIVFGNTSCMSYYQKMHKFQEAAESGHIKEAAKVLYKNKKAATGRNRLLYLMNAGWSEHMLSDRAKSNKWLNDADLMIEDYQKNIGLDALTLLSNPTIKPYKAESIESVMLNYYKAMNYLALNDRKDALVEARKITNKLYALNDKYKGKNNRYSDDAFAHILVGMIYEADGDFNNAFIAYRNAVETYTNIYQPNFGIATPAQLKQDVLRTAYLSGKTNELRRFERLFGLHYQHQKSEAQLVFFWENGFGPVKDENRLEFIQVGNSSGGIATFRNEELGLSFPVVISKMSDKEQSALAQFHIFELAFPKYLTRPPIYHTAELQANGQSYALSLAEDVNAISFKTLKDRMLREIGSGIARLVSKKAVEAVVRNENKDVGAVVGILNAITEVADTRNWQTLPYSISYVRIPLKVGENTMTLKLKSQGIETNSQALQVQVRKGQTKFVNYRTLSTHPPQSR